MSTSERPCHLSGIGRTAFDSSSQPFSPTGLTESSPFRVVITVPDTPTQSPRSRDLLDAHASSPTMAFEMKSWTSPERSRTVAKISLPESRLSMMRPATETASSVSTPGSNSPQFARNSASVCERSNRYGYGFCPCSRMVSRSASRRAFSAASPLPVSSSTSPEAASVESLSLEAGVCSLTTY